MTSLPFRVFYEVKFYEIKLVISSYIQICPMAISQNCFGVLWGVKQTKQTGVNKQTHIKTQQTAVNQKYGNEVFKGKKQCAAPF